MAVLNVLVTTVDGVKKVLLRDVDRDVHPWKSITVAEALVSEDATEHNRNCDYDSEAKHYFKLLSSDHYFVFPMKCVDDECEVCIPDQATQWSVEDRFSVRRALHWCGTKEEAETKAAMLKENDLIQDIHPISERRHLPSWATEEISLDNRENTYSIHPQAELQGEGNGWYDCPEEQATQWSIEDRHGGLDSKDSRAAAEAWVEHLKSEDKVNRNG